MTPNPSQRYTAAELAHLSGMSERTVRYYVRERLIDAPGGRGRGAHFDDRHLNQLHRVRLLQTAGLDHDAIRQHGQAIVELLEQRGLSPRASEHAWANFRAQAVEVYRDIAAGESAPTQTLVSRITIAPGIELLIDRPLRLPSPAKLAEVARVIRAALGVGPDVGESK